MYAPIITQLQKLIMRKNAIKGSLAHVSILCREPDAKKRKL